jgi:hypothetical protein
MDDFYKKFISHNQSILIAPAGYGKTFTIAECVKISEGKQLILTHTHAGVASIKEKIKASKISSQNYNVETITSFAQKYVLSFYTKDDVPDQDDTTNYYPFLIAKAVELLKKKTIANIIKNTYAGLYVDEYQDCTLKQHEYIVTLSEILPTRILGDHLQGIFNFNGEQLVDLEAMLASNSYKDSKYQLAEPWRWKKTNANALGEQLKAIRELLIAKQQITFTNYNAIELLIAQDGDIFNPQSQYSKLILSLMKEKSLLIIYPDSQNLNGRIGLVKRFSNLFTLLESIDGKDFYTVAKDLDSVTTQNFGLTLKGILEKMHGSTDVDTWFNNKGVIKKKKDQAELTMIVPLQNLISSFTTTPSSHTLFEIFKAFRTLPGVKIFRKDLHTSLMQALLESYTNEIPIYEAMINKRNLVRRIGRKIYGRCIGTTLLTKGLEFETVLVLDAHKFKCEKNLYVAITRASKRLIIVTNNSTINPYPVIVGEPAKI